MDFELKFDPDKFEEIRLRIIREDYQKATERIAKAKKWIYIAKMSGIFTLLSIFAFILMPSVSDNKLIYNISFLLCLSSIISFAFSLHRISVDCYVYYPDDKDPKICSTLPDFDTYEDNWMNLISPDSDLYYLPLMYNILFDGSYELMDISVKFNTDAGFTVSVSYSISGRACLYDYNFAHFEFRTDIDELILDLLPSEFHGQYQLAVYIPYGYLRNGNMEYDKRYYFDTKSLSNTIENIKTEICNRLI